MCWACLLQVCLGQLATKAKQLWHYESSDLIEAECQDFCLRWVSQTRMEAVIAGIPLLLCFKGMIFGKRRTVRVLLCCMVGQVLIKTGPSCAVCVNPQRGEDRIRKD